MKTIDLRNMTTEELNSKLVELKQTSFNLRFQHATGQLSNPINLRTIKKDIAKVKTVLTERENATNKKSV